MQMNPYLSFQGDCADAFDYYVRHLGATVSAIFRYGGSPMADAAPADWSHKVMHGSVRVGGAELMGGDVPPGQYAAPQGFSLSLRLSDTSEARRIFQALSDGGRVTMPLEPTFWAALFGMVVDRFGIPWLINCEGAGTAAS